MKKIEIIVADKIATPVGTPYIVCGNDNYVINFTFDSEWDGATQKTARFKYLKNGETAYEDVTFNGNICPVPVLSDITEVNIGVYVGDLETTTPAKVECRKSILCGDGTHEAPSKDVYNQLIEAINTGLVKGDKGEQGEQGVSGIYVGSGEMPESYNIQIDPTGEASADVLIKQALLSYMYPVGTYYWSSKSTNPSVLFGGTWEQIKDKFILAAGDSYSAGATGGEATHILTVEEMPSHSHPHKVAHEPSGDITLAEDAILYRNNGSTTSFVGEITYGENGGGQAHNNMPPYEVAYCWKRIS